MTFSQYTILYLEHPLTNERMNIGVAAWNMILEPNGARKVAEPEKLVWYFNRKWNRLEEIAGRAAPETWKAASEVMELQWSLTRLLNEVRRAPGDYTMLRFTEPLSGTQDATLTMMEAARFALKVE